MHIKIQLIVLSDDDQEETLEEVVTLEKEFEHLEQIGLTLTESKNILKQIQQKVIERQTSAYLKTHRQCERCGKCRKLKSYHKIVFRTLFGNIRLKSPRLYHCQCQKHRTKAFSPLVELLAEHTAPELLYLETKWASLVSYDKTAELLKEVLPIDDKINAATVRNHLHRVAQRKESKLGEERVKWYLWHGNVYEALFWLDDIEMLIYNFEESYTKFAKLEK